MPQITDVIYSDFNLAFLAHPETGELVTVTNAAAVIQAFKTLIFTNYFERFQQPFLASNCRAYLFEPADPITASHLQDEIVRLAASDNRLKLLSVTVTPELAEAGYTVVITVSVISQTEPVVVKFFLERLR